MDEVARGWRRWPAADEHDVEVALTYKPQRTQQRRIDPGIEMQIAMLTGQSVRDVLSILNARHPRRDPARALDAIRKLENDSQDIRSSSNRA